MPDPALSTALAHMLYAASDEQAMEWARRVVRLKHQAGEYDALAMLDEATLENLAKQEMEKRR